MELGTLKEITDLRSVPSNVKAVRGLAAEPQKMKLTNGCNNLTEYEPPAPLRGGWFLQPYSLFNAAQILTLLLLLLSSIAVSAAVPYLNCNTKPLFINGKNSFLP